MNVRVSLLLLGLLPACDTESFECECAPCGPAIVVAGAGASAGGVWNVTATLDGAPVDTSACAPDVRGASVECGFGTATGVYQLLVTSPNGQREVAARFASQVGQNCCACIASERVQVEIP